MPKCNDCGFLEKEMYSGIIYPLNKEHAGIPETRGFCTANWKKREKVNDLFTNTACKNFIEKRASWTTKDYHEVKDRHVTLRRSSLLAIIAIFISIISLSYPIASQYVASFQPQVILTIEYFPASVIGSVNGSLTDSFIVFNKGTEVGFLEQMHIFKVLQNGNYELIDKVDLGRMHVNPSETAEIEFSITPYTSGEAGTNFRIAVFYDVNKMVWSPVSTAVWTD